jgi:DNA-binding phage protein
MTEPPLTEQDVIRLLRELYYRPTIASLAKDAGLHRATLDRAILTGRLSERTRKAVERVLRTSTMRPSDIRRSQSLLARLGGRLPTYLR